MYSHDFSVFSRCDVLGLDKPVTCSEGPASSTDMTAYPSDVYEAWEEADAGNVAINPVHLFEDVILILKPGGRTSPVFWTCM